MDPHRRCQNVELHPFLLCLLDLDLLSRHLGTGATVDHGNLFGTQTPGNPGSIDGSIAAPDDYHSLSQFDLLPAVHPPQEVKGMDYP